MLFNPTVFLGQAGGADVLDWAVRLTQHPPLWVIVLVIVPWTTALVWWIYKGESVNKRGLRTFLIGIRTSIILLVLAILLQPVIVHTRSRTEKPYVALLFDDSASMSSKDKYVDEEKRDIIKKLALLPPGDELSQYNRIDLVKRILGNDSESTNILARLKSRAEVKLFSFASQVTPEANLDRLSGHGSVTRLGDALRTVQNEFRGRRLASIVVFTDGRSNEGELPPDVAEDLASESIPVVVVGVGDPDTPEDVSIQAVAAPQSVLKDDEVIFQVSVQSVGFENREINVELMKDGVDHPISSRPLLLEGAGRQQKVLLYYRASDPGTHRFTVRIPPLEGESILENNERVRTLTVIQKKIKLLYVEGYPRWEYRYLKNALVRDTETMEASCQLLSADAMFAQEATAGQKPLSHMHLPRGKELFEYDVVLFGDVDPYDLGASETERTEFMDDVVTLVEELGGGFGMIAGERDSPHHFRGTPIERLLPVVIDVSDDDIPYSLDREQLHQVKLTELGRAHEITLLESDPEEAMALFDEGYLPGHYWFCPVKKAKAGAQVLAVHPERRNKYGYLPVFAAQFYASGRTFFSGIDSTWRWRMGQGDRHFYRFWSQVIRFLAKSRLSSKDKRVELFLDKSEYHVGEKVTITATVRDQDFRPAEKASQNAKLRTPTERDPKPIELRPTQTKPGTYTQSFTVREIGTHRVSIEGDSTSSDGEVESIGFDVVIPSIELENPVLDKPTLSALATTSHGEFLALNDLERLPEIPRCDPIIVPSVIIQEELWDKWSVLLLLGGLLVTEWTLRKRNRLL